VAVNTRAGRSRTSWTGAQPRGRALPRWPPQWPEEAWWAIGVTTLFLCLTWWWITQDESVPISDPGFHLTVAIGVFRDLQAGHWGKAVTPSPQYPPLLYLVAATGALVGGLGIPSMVIAENLFYVPLLALGCYQIGRLAFSPRAGLLAVVFALGTPLVAKLLHMTMLDAPQAAMVATSVWLILATGYFTRLRFCAVAGLAVGLAMLTKESAALFIVGVLGVTLLRGGWREWRGLLVFGVVVFVVAGPWYIHNFTEVRAIGSGVATGTATHSSIAPARFSSENLQWYMWSFLSAQIFLPLFLFAAVGWVWTLVGFLRRRWVSQFAPELAVGAFVAWLALTETFVHDIRYGMSMLVYFAVFGSFWIARLPRPGRIAATAALVLVAIVNTLGSTFGVGGNWTVTLPQALSPTKGPSEAVIDSNEGYLVHSAPDRSGDMLGTLRALRREGVQAVVLLPSEAPNEAPFLEGLLPLTMIAGINLALSEDVSPANLNNAVAVFDREKLSKNTAPPCVTLGDETGVWIRLGNPYTPGAKDFCPSRKPQFYSQ
jgi:Dolichyl-phosphate-mannose-protein mannosyltransferase